MTEPGTDARGSASPSPARTGVLAVVAAAGAALVVHGVFEAAGADFLVEPPGQAQSRVGAGQAAVVAGIVAAVGAALTALLARRSARPRRLVVGLVVVGLLLFAATPLLAADQPLTVVALEVMHLAVVLPALSARQDRVP